MTKFNRLLLLGAFLVLALSATARPTAKLPNLFNQVDQVTMN